MRLEREQSRQQQEEQMRLVREQSRQQQEGQRWLEREQSKQQQEEHMSLEREQSKQQQEEEIRLQEEENQRNKQQQDEQIRMQEEQRRQEQIGLQEQESCSRLQVERLLEEAGQAEMSITHFDQATSLEELSMMLQSPAGMKSHFVSYVSSVFHIIRELTLSNF